MKKAVFASALLLALIGCQQKTQEPAAAPAAPAAAPAAPAAPEAPAAAPAAPAEQPTDKK